jgi:VanZ family protein
MLRYALAWGWTLVILVLCWWPTRLLPVSETARVPFFTINVDKLVHFSIFATFAVLWMRVRRPAGTTGRVLLAGLVLTVVSELGQLVPAVGRDANLPDAAADLVGVGIGLLAYRMVSGARPKAETITGKTI